jgi:acyl CoA:acetate/3-ketoacid CoA transferase
MKLSPEGLVVTEVAPGIDIRDDILARADIPLTIAADVKPMADALFRPEKFGLRLEDA